MIHDWTKIFDGAFHDIHLEWISTIKQALNERVLPPGYYASAEQVAGDGIADVLTLQRSESGLAATGETAEEAAVAVLTSSPEVSFTFSADPDFPAVPRSRIAIRHRSRSRSAVVAIIEIVSSGNKRSQRAIDAFAYKAIDLLQSGVHLLVVDLIPPGPRDPQGIHGVIWRDLCDGDFALPPGKPLTVAAYVADQAIRAFVEPFAVGGSLKEMPLFLTPDSHVLVPLEMTYAEAFARVPADWRAELERQEP